MCPDAGSSRWGTVHKGELGLNLALAGSMGRPARWSQQMPFLRVDTVRAPVHRRGRGMSPGVGKPASRFAGPGATAGLGPAPAVLCDLVRVARSLCASAATRSPGLAAAIVFELLPHVGPGTAHPTHAGYLILQQLWG